MLAGADLVVRLGLSQVKCRQEVDFLRVPLRVFLCKVYLK